MDEDMKTFCAIVSVVLILLSIITTLLIITKAPSKHQLTKIYQNVTVPEAKQLIESTDNLSIVDVRGLDGCSSCQFNKGHLPGAVLNMNPYTFYNSTNDILVYSKDGTKGEWFCSELLGHVYGKIYNLEGGWGAWKAYKEGE